MKARYSKYIYFSLLACSIMFFLCFFKPVTVSAGSINGNESQVLGVLSGSFEYNGKTYKAGSSYLAEAKSYLAQDGVDLSASDAQQAISTIYGNIETAVLNGYLTEVSGNTEEKKNNDKKEETGKEEVVPDQSEKSEEGKGAKEDAKVSADLENPDDKDTNIDETILEQFPETEKVDVHSDSSDASVTAVNSDGSQIVKVSGIIKNTGFNFNNTVLALIVLFIILVATVIVTCRFYLFAHDYEQKV